MHQAITVYKIEAITLFCLLYVKHNTTLTDFPNSFPMVGLPHILAKKSPGQSSRLPRAKLKLVP